MARGPKYRVKFRRRREGKTDYRRRKGLIKSGKPRVVVRITNKHVIVQFVEAKVEGDHVLVTAVSKELQRYGWLGDENNLPAAYLTGYLAGLKAIQKGVREGIADIGLHRPTKGARVFAALKGVIDAGVEVPVGEEVIPSSDRIVGEHIKSYAEMLKSDNPEKYSSVFSRYLKRGLPPENLPEHFKEIKTKIASGYFGERINIGV